MTDDTPEGQPFSLGKVFAGQEDVLRSELDAGAQASHAGVQGAGTEDQWLELLKKRLPRRYDVTRAIVVDSRGNRSQQIDLVLHDRIFSPLWWEWGDHRYVPAESVYAVFEVKPEVNRDYVLYAAEKVASVRSLHRTSDSFGWAQGTMEPRPQFEIIGGLLAASSGWSPAFGGPFQTALRDADADAGGALDLGCVLGHGAFEIPNGKAADDVVVSEPGVALVTFLLTLLHRLQGIGSAPAIEYGNYLRWIGADGDSR
jgi:hypothetical protein